MVDGIFPIIDLSHKPRLWLFLIGQLPGVLGDWKLDEGRADPVAHHILDRYSYIITLLVPDGALYEGKISENPACHLHCIGHLECGVSPIHPRDCSFSLWLDKGLVGGDSMRRRIDEQLLIALFDLSHSEELFELIHHNRDHFGKWLEFPHKTHTVEDARNFITRCIHKNASGNGGWCGIWDEHRLIGAIGLVHINWMDKTTEIGYYIAQDYEGRGIIRRACQEVVKYNSKTWRLIGSRLEFNPKILEAEKSPKASDLPKKAHCAKRNGSSTVSLIKWFMGYSKRSGIWRVPLKGIGKQRI